MPSGHPDIIPLPLTHRPSPFPPAGLGLAAALSAYYALKPIPTDDSSRRLPRIGETPAEGRGSAGGKIPTSKGSVGSEKPAPPPH